MHSDTFSNPVNGAFGLAYYIGDRKTGTITLVTGKGETIQTSKVPVLAETGVEQLRRPVLIGLTEDRRVVLFDPVSKEIELSDGLPADTFPAHIYRDGYSSRAWFMNDGDKETGNDTLNFGDQGSSVTVIDDPDSSTAKFLDILCVGRGHHQAAYSRPGPGGKGVPAKAYVSNLKDGNISVIGNDPDVQDTDLKVVATIDLIEEDKDDASGGGNSAFPHGIDYSEHTGLIYNLNNGYGTVAVIDPVTDRIVECVPFKGHSNLFAVPGGRFLIGRGADRKSDPEHVVAKLSVMDAATRETVASIELPDVYISKYYFSPDGKRLYLTASASGSPEQKANCKDDALLIFDLTSLPAIGQPTELRLGAPVGTLDFQALPEGGTRVFASLGASGEVAIFDDDGTEGVHRIQVAEGGPHSRLWLIGG